MNRRELALELAQLKSSDRDALLVELPPHKRAELLALIEEITGLIEGGKGRFEVHLDVLDESRPVAASSAPPSAAARLARLNDGQLRLLLGQESSGVQRRLTAAIRSGVHSPLPPAVNTIVMDYLARRCETSEVASPSEKRRSWWSLFRRERA